MEIQYLEEFIALAKDGSYSAASITMHVSQPTLTRHIQSLEKEIGHPLFNRSTRTMELSEYGKLFLPYAKKIVAEKNKADSVLSEYESQLTGKMNIGVAHQPELYTITDYLLLFRRAYPNISLNCFEGPIDELENEYESGRLNLITTAEIEWKRFPDDGVFIPFGESRLVVLLPEDHPLAEMTTIPLSALAGVPLLSPKRTYFSYQCFIHYMAEEGITPDIVYQGSVSGCTQLLKEGMGVLVQDERVVETQREEGLVVRKLDPDIVYTFGLLRRKKLTQNERAFLAFVDKVKNSKK